MCKLNDLTMQA